MSCSACEVFPFTHVGRLEADIAPESSNTPDYSGPPFANNIPCRIKAVSGGESYRGRQLEPKIKFVVEMNFIPGVLPTMRFVPTGGLFDGRILNIAAALPRERPGEPTKLELDCTELVV